jgi:UDP-glucose 4-epimerase
LDLSLPGYPSNIPLAMAKILVVGGAGYIGSQVVRDLKKNGHNIVVIDNLSTGFRESLPDDVPLILADLCERRQVEQAVAQANVGMGGIDCVFHFAAAIDVEESVQNPDKYHRINVGGTENLLCAMTEHNIKRIIFSSTAAVYGNPKQGFSIAEDSECAPLSPYGETKLRAEQKIQEWAFESPHRSMIVFRYFNAAGASRDGKNGPRNPKSRHLIKNCIDAIHGKMEGVTIFGTDYDTEDGTCIRDFLYVEDIARAHLLGLIQIDGVLKNQILNLGSGKGFSVLQVIRVIEEVFGAKIPLTLGPRRKGDAKTVVADSSKIEKLVGWKSTPGGLQLIAQSLKLWMKNLEK